MEENTVVTTTETPVDAGTEMSAADLLAGEDQQPAEPVEDMEVDAPQQEETEDDKQIAMGREIQRIRNAERQRYEQAMQQHQPAIEVGMRIIEDIMRSTGATPEQAARIAEANFVRAVAGREGVSENIARMLMHNQRQQQAQRPQQLDVGARAAQIREEIAGMQLPQGFDFDTAVQDERFAEMLLSMPTQYAVRLYHAEQMASKAPQDIAEKLRARQKMPQPGKPQQPARAAIDFGAMSSEEFWAYEQKLKSQN